MHFLSLDFFEVENFLVSLVWMITRNGSWPESNSTTYANHLITIFLHSSLSYVLFGWFPTDFIHFHFFLKKILMNRVEFTFFFYFLSPWTINFQFSLKIPLNTVRVMCEKKLPMITSRSRVTCVDHRSELKKTRNFSSHFTKCGVIISWLIENVMKSRWQFESYKVFRNWEKTLFFLKSWISLLK